MVVFCQIMSFVFKELFCDGWGHFNLYDYKLKCVSKQCLVNSVELWRKKCWNVYEISNKKL